MTIYTMGYEGFTADAFIARLRMAGVSTVIDVRELPLSRKRGFSKTAFAALLAAAGIAYAHMPAMGCPRPVRNQYKLDGNWVTYTRGFEAYLATQGASVRELGRMTRTTASCLVCFEADFNRCHRSMVGRAAAGISGQRLVHLNARTAIPDVSVRAASAVGRSG